MCVCLLVFVERQTEIETETQTERTELVSKTRRRAGRENYLEVEYEITAKRKGRGNGILPIL